MDSNYKKVLLAGFGGQGILLAGKVLANAFIENGMNTSWLPSYGPEMRGGTCNCQVVANIGEILSPVCTYPNLMIIMNQQSLDFFIERMMKVEKLIINSDLVSLPNSFRERYQSIKSIGIAANSIALDLGNIRFANMVMLGAFLKGNDVLSIESLKKSLRMEFESKGRIADQNIIAVEKGYLAAEFM